jgi:hypothetical protein
MITIIVFFLKLLSVLWTIMGVIGFILYINKKDKPIFKFNVKDLIYFTLYITSIWVWFHF